MTTIEITRDEYERQRKHPLPGFKVDMECRYVMVADDAKPKKRKVVKRTASTWLRQSNTRKFKQALSEAELLAMQHVIKILERNGGKMQSKPLCEELATKMGGVAYATASSRISDLMRLGRIEVVS